MKPLILVTNDDGVFSPGLAAAVEAIEAFGEPLIVAPRFQQTSLSRAYPKAIDTGIIEALELVINDSKYTAYAVHGSPAQAVSHAILELAPRKPDLCISGINYGENLGLGIIASGTVGAALEADTYDIPSIAVSLEASLSMQHSETYNQLDWQGAIHFARLFAARALHEGLPKEVATLNVNVPAEATSGTPIRRTSQSRQNYFVFVRPEKRDHNTAYRFKVEIEIDRDALEPDSDIQAMVFDRVVSVTPLAWSLTAHTAWGEEYS